MTVKEAMKFFGLSKPTMLKMLNSGKIDGFKIGRQWRVRRIPSKAGLNVDSNSSTMGSLQKTPSAKR